MNNFPTEEGFYCCWYRPSPNAKWRKGICEANITNGEHAKFYYTVNGVILYKGMYDAIFGPKLNLTFPDQPQQ